jgi:hypothetical protein
MNNLCPFSELWYENFTVAINPISVKILEREGCTAFGMTVNEILTTPSCFFSDSQVYSPTCLSIEEGLNQ